MIKLANPTVGMDIAGIINKMYPTINEQHDFMYTKMIPTMQKVLGEIRDLVTEKGNRDYFENFTLHPTTTPLTSVTWDWKDYFYYLSLNGLEEANCFKTDFPEKSYEYKLFTTYISNGNKYLNK
jgi:hypothetical protein